MAGAASAASGFADRGPPATAWCRDPRGSLSHASAARNHRRRGGTGGSGGEGEGCWRGMVFLWNFVFATRIGQALYARDSREVSAAGEAVRGMVRATGRGAGGVSRGGAPAAGGDSQEIRLPGPALWRDASAGGCCADVTGVEGR